MGKRASLVALGVVVFAALLGVGFAGEAKKQKPKRKRPEPISVDDYVAAINELHEIAATLATPDGAAKFEELKDRAEGILKKLRQPTARLKRILGAGDAATLARELRMFTYRSLIGKLNYQRRTLIQSKPELKQEYDQFREREKQIAKEREAFYQKLRAASPEIDKLEKVLEQVRAQMEKERQAEAARRKKAREKKQ